jgi:hypothetical protein
MCAADLIVALDLFLADIQQPDLGPRNALHGAHQLAAHDRELEQCAALQSTLAPRSSMCVTPTTEGIALMMAGRSTSGSVLSTKRAVAISAPVLPALTQASACPDLTRSIRASRSLS